ncbi:MAG: efflux RND transporter periplasmic adaptor subunit, partial [Candidatus Competibacteraceae bacterium]|nr:efflux RND transporter periplasmic adaptor subunit [Candidatus Competibacteraceae bacterium]
MTDKTRYLPTCYLPTHTGLLLLLLGLLLTTSSHSQTAEPESAAAAISTPRLVKTLILDSATQGDGLVLPGRVQAAERTQLAFQVGGPLIELPVVEGQQVQKGDLLARLDPRDYENQLALQAAKLKLVQSQYQRFEKLIKTKTSPISKAEFDRKQSEYEIAKADTAQARKNLDDTTLLAPFDGLVAV